MGGDEDPKDGSAVAGAVFGAVFIYIVSLSFLFCSLSGKLRVARSLLTGWAQGFFVFCGLQALLHMRESRRGAISLS